MRRIASDKVLRDKAYNTAKNSSYDENQSGLASMVYKCFDQKTLGGAVKNENLSNKELAEELNKPLLQNLKNERYAHLLQTIFGGDDRPDVHLISKFSKGIRFSLYVIDIFGKCA